MTAVVGLALLVGIVGEERGIFSTIATAPACEAKVVYILGLTDE